VAEDFASEDFASAGFASGAACAAAKGRARGKIVRRKEKTRNFGWNEDRGELMIQILHRCSNATRNPNKYFGILNM
jgi:hypothetical protein